MSNNSFAYTQLLASDKPQALDATVFAPKDGIAERAYITVESGWRVMFHGEEPERTLGHLLRDGAILTLDGELNIRNFRALSMEPHSVLSVSFERK